MIQRRSFIFGAGAALLAAPALARSGVLMPIQAGILNPREPGQYYSINGRRWFPCKDAFDLTRGYLDRNPAYNHVMLRTRFGATSVHFASRTIEVAPGLFHAGESRSTWLNFSR